MRTILLPFAFVLLATPALAQSMPNSLNMSCATATNLVRQQGGVVIATGPNIFDRYVASQRYCSLDQTTVPAWIQTSDQKQCFVGYRCRDPLARNR